MIQIARESHVPLHTQLANEVRRLILAGQWPPGSRLPSESELCSQLSVSRNTVRLALLALEHQGYVLRQAGKGSFAASPARPAGEAPSPAIQEQLLALVLPQIREPLPHAVFLGVQSVARQRGYQLVLADSSDLPAEEAAALERLDRAGLRHFIVWPTADQERPYYVEQLLVRGCAVVQVDRYLDGLAAPYVGCDHFSGGFIATRHLIERGYRGPGSPAFVGDEIAASLSSARERYAGYRAACEAAGIMPGPMILLPPGEPAGTYHEYGTAFLARQRNRIDRLAAWLAGATRPVGIFAMHDFIAYQVLLAAREAGLSVPEDVGVVGFNNTEMCAEREVCLTSVAQDGLAIGGRACELLLDGFQSAEGARPAGMRFVRLPVELIVRESSRGPA